MELILTGINHKTAPLDIRGRVSLKKNQIDKIYKFFINKDLVEELIILSTCNRTEFYILIKKYLNPDIKKIVYNFLKQFFDLNFDLDNYLYFKKNKIALEHLCNVTSGIDSQLLGEREILDQIKEALIESKKYLKNEDLEYLFKQALEIGNYTRFNTDIAFGDISFGSIVIELIKKEFKILDNKKIIVIGTGKIANDIAKSLQGYKTKLIFIANKHFWKADILARIYKGSARRLEELDNLIKYNDVIVSCTSSPHIILKREDIAKFKNNYNKLLLIDLACPRDIEKIKTTKNITHYDLDDLVNFTNAILETRKNSLNKAKKIIEDKICTLELEPAQVY
ncbi:MAG: glutamyl-tRNA reductase [Candidatus Omnitrophota bacterium]